MKKYLDDPDFAEILTQELGDEARPGDQEMMNGYMTFLSQMAENHQVAQANYKSSLPPVWKQPVHSNAGPSHAGPSQKVIGINYSDGDDSDGAGKSPTGAGKAKDLQLQRKLSSIDWGGLELPEKLVIPTLVALKEVSGSNSSIMDSPSSMRRILQLGLTAFNDENIHLSESSAGSDVSSKRRSSQSPPRGSSSKRQKITITIPGTRPRPRSKAQTPPPCPFTALNLVDNDLEEAAEASRWTAINTDAFENDGDEEDEEPSEMDIIMTKKDKGKGKDLRRPRTSISLTSSTESEDQSE